MIIPYFYLMLAIVLEVLANVLMKVSRGFAYKKPAILAIVCVLGAFTALSFAVRSIPLSVAYGIWGGVGLIATALLGIKLFHEHIQLKGWIGIILIIIGVSLIKIF